MNPQTDPLAELKASREIFMGWLWFSGSCTHTPEAMPGNRAHLSASGVCFSRLRGYRLGLQTRAKEFGSGNQECKGTFCATWGSSWGKTEAPGPLLVIPNIHETINSVFPPSPVNSTMWQPTLKGKEAPTILLLSTSPECQWKQRQLF